jgi:hypothetical protein
LHGGRFAAGLGDIGDDFIGACLARCIVYDDRRAGGGELAGDSAPMPFDAPVTNATLPSNLRDMFCTPRS